jgi:hypothetical protein
MCVLQNIFGGAFVALPLPIYRLLHPDDIPEPPDPFDFAFHHISP